MNSPPMILFFEAENPILHKHIFTPHMGSINFKFKEAASKVY